MHISHVLYFYDYIFLDIKLYKHIKLNNKYSNEKICGIQYKIIQYAK